MSHSLNTVFLLVCGDYYGNMRVLQNSCFQSSTEIMVFSDECFWEGKEGEEFVLDSRQPFARI